MHTVLDYGPMPQYLPVGTAVLVLRSTDRADAVGFFSAQVVNITGASVVVQYNIDSLQQQVDKPQIMALEHCQSTDLLPSPSVPSELVLNTVSEL